MKRAEILLEEVSGPWIIGVFSDQLFKSGGDLHKRASEDIDPIDRLQITIWFLDSKKRLRSDQEEKRNRERQRETERDRERQRERQRGENGLGEKMVQVRDPFQGTINKSISSQDRACEHLHDI
jgi:hypothetical protein